VETVTSNVFNIKNASIPVPVQLFYFYFDVIPLISCKNSDSDPVSLYSIGTVCKLAFVIIKLHRDSKHFNYIVVKSGYSLFELF
jgi:hypothetical protein